MAKTALLVNLVLGISAERRSTGAQHVALFALAGGGGGGRMDLRSVAGRASAGTRGAVRNVTASALFRVTRAREGALHYRESKSNTMAH